MYVAMNRFRIVPGKEQEFIDVWKNRDSQLKETPGFKEFKLLQGGTNKEFTLFASHVIWASEEHFNLETSVGCEKDVQDIAVQRKFSKLVFTLLVMRAF